MNNENFKKPAFIAACVILFSFLVLDYATWRGQGKSGIGVATADNLAALDNLLWLIPVVAGFLIFTMLSPKHEMASEKNVKIAKIALLSLVGFFLLRYLFVYSKHGISAGIGLWISLLAALFLQFEDLVMEKIKGGKS